MNTIEELREGRGALQNFFSRKSPSALSQLGYNPRQDQFVARTVKLLSDVEFMGVGQNSYSVKGIGLLEYIRLTRVMPGVVEFRASRDIVMEEAPQNNNILAEVREQTIREKRLNELVNIFGNLPNIPRTIVQVCVLLDPQRSRMEDPDWLTKVTHPLSSYITSGFVRTDRIDDPKLVVIPNTIAYASKLNECILAVEMKHSVRGRTSERWRILRGGSEESLCFVGRVANVGR